MWYTMHITAWLRSLPLKLDLKLPLIFNPTLSPSVNPNFHHHPLFFAIFHCKARGAFHADLWKGKARRRRRRAYALGNSTSHSRGRGRGWKPGQRVKRLGLDVARPHVRTNEPHTGKERVCVCVCMCVCVRVCVCVCVVYERPLLSRGTRYLF